MARLAIDSLPLRGDIHETTDYSGLQLYGLGTVALQDCPHQLRVSECACVHRVMFEDSLETGMRPDHSAQMFADGLIALLRKRPTLRATAFRTLVGLRASSDVLELTLSRPVAGFADVFEIPNWVATRDGRPYPNGALERTGAKEWRILDADRTVRHRIHLVSSVAENRRMADAGELDFTADTCVDYASVDAAYCWAETGLHAHLVPWTPRGRSALPDLCDYRPDLSAIPGLHGKDGGSPPRQGSALTIEYDDFHPNRDICCDVARYLGSRGWNVSLLQDDYYEPARRGDLKLVIKRPLVNGDLFKAYSLLEFARTREQMEAIAPHIYRAEAGLAVDSGRVLEEHRLAKPLVAIPSVFLPREPDRINPMIRNLARRTREWL